ncbi:hypothetical protein [Priestia flexa]|uniref:hypothetical protein n=1 Tax=Priestia flexa TaxID=86664 RepID=UPI0004732808|nr:hypothetical protein [Priestia flexa]
MNIIGLMFFICFVIVLAWAIVNIKKEKKANTQLFSAMGILLVTSFFYMIHATDLKTELDDIKPKYEDAVENYEATEYRLEKSEERKEELLSEVENLKTDKDLLTAKNKEYEDKEESEPAEEEAKTEEVAAQPEETEEPEAVEEETNYPSINMDEFNRIKDGMTYEQVKAVAGGEGTLQSETGQKGDEFYTAMYGWDGEGSTGANVLIMFQGSPARVVSKSQFGL